MGLVSRQENGNNVLALFASASIAGASSFALVKFTRSKHANRIKRTLILIQKDDQRRVIIVAASENW